MINKPKTYAITHCYTDKNKGDAAIIQSTIALLRKVDPDANIILFSTFGPNDSRFFAEHDFIRPLADAIYPGILHSPQKPSLMPYECFRIVPFILNLAQSLLLLVSASPSWIKLFARGDHAKGAAALARADVIISKGGSYLTSQNHSFRQMLSLLTMLYPFVFAARYRRPCVIFSQSLGPVEGRFNRFLFQIVLRKVKKIFIRESLCRELYPCVNALHKMNEMTVIPDSAFYYEPPLGGWKGSHEYQETLSTFDKSRLRVGLTIVDHAFIYFSDLEKRKVCHATYVKAISDLISHLRKTYDAQVHIFPQVTVANSYEGHSDVLLSRHIASSFFAAGDCDVQFHEHNFTPLELRMLYSKMDLFVGTRLHSVIFATSTGCPAINIAYHGTKSHGIFSDFETLRSNVLHIDTISSQELIERVEDLIQRRHLLRPAILQEVARMRNKLVDAMQTAVKFCNASS